MPTKDATKRRAYENKRRTFRCAALRRAGIPQVDVISDREPTAEEEAEITARIYAAGAEIQVAKCDGRLPLHKGDCKPRDRDPQIKEFGKVRRNGVPIYS